MVATPIAPPVIFNSVSNEVVYWVPTIANISAPTRAELDAGIDLTAAMPIDGVTGFSLAGKTVAVTNLATGFEGVVSNGRSVGTSSLMVYISETGDTDVRSLIHYGDRGNVVLFDTGDVTGGLMDIYPVTVNSVEKSRDTSKGAMVKIDFANGETPAENVAVPA